MRNFAAATAAAFVLVGGGTAFADGATQPADLGNVADADRGASAGGALDAPHCHFVLPARGTASGFTDVITGANHQGHVETGLPTGVFQAAPCP